MASFLLLIVEPRGQREARTPAEGQAAYDAMVGFAQNLQARGKLAAVESLRHDRDGVRLQLRDGKRKLVDGPFAEAKEMVGGFFLLRDVTREEALAIAAECPAAQFATVEVRETGPCFT